LIYSAVNLSVDFHQEENSVTITLVSALYKNTHYISQLKYHILKQ
jgi:hypothetical protein